MLCCHDGMFIRNNREKWHLVWKIPEKPILTVLPASSPWSVCLLTFSYIWIPIGVEWQLQIRVARGSPSTEGNAQAVGWRLKNSPQPRRAASLMGFLPYLTAAKSDAGDERDKDDCCRVWTVVTGGAQSAHSWHHTPRREVQSGNCQLKVALCQCCTATRQSHLSVWSDWSASFHSNQISRFPRDGTVGGNLPSGVATSARSSRVTFNPMMHYLHLK